MTMSREPMTPRNVTHWKIGQSIDVFDIVSGAEAGVMHCHATVNIGAVIEGQASVEWSGATHAQPRGSVILLNAFEAHASAWHGMKNRYFVINIAEPAWIDLCAMITQGEDRLRLQGPISHDQILFHTLLGIRAELSTGSHKVGIEDVAGLLEAMVRRSVLIEDDLPSLETVEEFRSRLGQVLDCGDGGGPKIDQIAQELGLSRFQLSRLVRQSAGMQPRRLRLQLMVATAQFNIANGLSLSYAAANSGFADQSHMNREFRRTLGMTPREYQQVRIPSRTES
jgi:AraC-like DNA-binding protein